MQTLMCERCNGTGLVAVSGNAPMGTGRCPVCQGGGLVEQPSEVTPTTDDSSQATNISNGHEGASSEAE